MKQQITKKAIKTAYTSLLSIKPIEKITVRDIVDECGLTRNTFYYYYKDVYEIAEELVTDKTKVMIDSLYNGTTNWQKFCDNLVNVFVNNYKIIANMVRSNDDMLLKNFDKVADLAFVFYVDDKTKCISISENDRMFIISMFKFMFRGAFFEFVKNGKSDVLIEFLSKFEKLFGDSFFASYAENFGNK